MGGGDKNQMVSCIVAKESILLILIHSLKRLCSSQQCLINFSKKCVLSEFFLEGRTVGGKMGGGDKNQMVSCIVAKESILLFLIHLLIRLRSSWQYLINFLEKCGLSEFFLEGRTVGGKMGGFDKNQMVSCIVAKESILLILIHSLKRLCSSQQCLINFSKKCGISEFFLEGRTVGGKMGGGDKNQMVSCIVAKESILLFLIHLLIRLRSSWQYLINFSEKCGLSEFFLEGRTVGGKMGGGDKNQMVSCIVAKESILLILIHSLKRLCSSQQCLINFSKKCGISEFFLEGRTVGGKMGGGDKKQVVSCIVAQESILVFLIHSRISLCSSWQYLTNFSEKCGLSEFFLEGRTVEGKMGGGDKNQMVSCIVAKESILLFLIHLLIRLRSSWQYLINFSKKW